MVQKIKIIQEYLLLLLPVFLITGPFLPDLTISLIGLFYVSNKFLNKEFNISDIDIFGKVFFLWCIYLIFLSLISENPYLSLESSLFFFRFGLFAYAVKKIILDNNHILIKFFYVLLASVILVLFDGYIQYFLGKNLMGFSYDNYRLMLFDNDKIIGHYLARLIPLLFAIALFFHTKLKFNILILMLIFIGADVLIFLSGERTSFFILTFFTFSILFLISKWKLIRLISVVLSIIIIYFIINSNGYVKQRMYQQTINQTNWGVTFSPEHDLLYESSINMFLDNIFLGVGPKIFRLKCDEKKYAKDIFGYRDVITEWDEQKSCSSHPHNIYIQLLAETGIIGILPLLAYYFYILFKLFKQFFGIVYLRKYFFSDYSVCLMISVFVQLWPIMPHLSVFSNRINVFIFLTIGLLMAGKHLKDK